MGISTELDESTAQLVEKSRTGCLASFERLVRMHEKAIYNYLLQITGNLHDAEDAAQETFVKAYHSLHRFDSRYRFSPWLFSIAKRTAISLQRKRPRHESIEHHEEMAARNENGSSGAEGLWVLAKRLKPKLFEALWLYYGEGFDLKETSRIMGTNSIHVKVLLHRARRELRKKIRPEDWQE